jgi:hypothetical protein
LEATVGDADFAEGLDLFRKLLGPFGSHNGVWPQKIVIAFFRKHSERAAALSDASIGAGRAIFSEKCMVNVAFLLNLLSLILGPADVDAASTIFAHTDMLLQNKVNKGPMELLQRKTSMTFALFFFQ